MDLSKLNTAAADQGVEMVLRHPATDDALQTEGGQPISITLAGGDSERARKARNAAHNRRLQRMNKKLTAESLEAEGLDVLVACTLGWQNIHFEGEDLAFSPDNARKLYKAVPWIREQVDAFIVDRANFLPSA